MDSILKETVRYPIGISHIFSDICINFEFNFRMRFFQVFYCGKFYLNSWEIPTDEKSLDIST